jgi:hypothetical protein
VTAPLPAGLAYLFTDLVTVIHGEEPDDEAVTRTTYRGRLTTNNAGRPYGSTPQATSVTDESVMLPPDAEVDPKDQIEIGGVPYEISGVPKVARTPHGVHHITVDLLRAE